MSATRTLVSAASASGLLPWLLLGAVVAAGAIGGGGYWWGHRSAARACEVEKLASQVAAQTHQAKAVAKAQATSERIWDIGLALNVDLAVGRQRAAARTIEVTRYVDADPDLAGCIVPAAVQRLRDEQVRDSDRAAQSDPVRR